MTTRNQVNNKVTPYELPWNPGQLLYISQNKLWFVKGRRWLDWALSWVESSRGTSSEKRRQTSRTKIQWWQNSGTLMIELRIRALSEEKQSSKSPGSKRSSLMIKTSQNDVYLKCHELVKEINIVTSFQLNWRLKTNLELQTRPISALVSTRWTFWCANEPDRISGARDLEWSDAQRVFGIKSASAIEMWRRKFEDREMTK
jgi:hypothetical protein